MPIVSIIMAVYNSEKVLSKSIDSILEQSFEDFELLLVNDGSTDASGELCERFASYDSRIKVFHKENGGQSSARNLGLSKAIGKYIYFADNDDELVPNCLDVLLNGFSDDGIELAIARPLFAHNYIVDKKDLDVPHTYRIFSKKQFLNEFFLPQFFPLGFPWINLFRKDIIEANNLKFNEKLIGNEDRVFLMSYVSKIKGRIYHTTEPVYIWNVGKGISTPMAQHYNMRYVTVFYGQSIIYKIVVENKYPLRIKLLAKKQLMNSFIDKRDFYTRYNDYETVAKMEQNFFQQISYIEFYPYYYVKILKKLWKACGAKISLFIK